jgi:hypothetical protein
MMSSPDSREYPDPVDVHRERLSIDELAAVTGVSRRTVHFYAQRRLIDPPLGRGRGRHWDRRHALQILKVRDLQRRGVSLSAMVDGDLPTVARPDAEAGAAATAPATAGATAGPPAGAPAEGAKGEPPPRRARPSITSVVRIKVDENVTVELATGFETITGELVDHLVAAVAQVMAKHRPGT